jgi:hypothetical protein
MEAEAPTILPGIFFFSVGDFHFFNRKPMSVSEVRRAAALTRKFLLEE